MRNVKKELVIALMIVAFCGIAKAEPATTTEQGTSADKTNVKVAHSQPKHTGKSKPMKPAPAKEASKTGAGATETKPVNPTEQAGTTGKSY